MATDEKAPDATVLDAEGSVVQISALWQKNNLLLVFTRHLG